MCLWYWFREYTRCGRTDKGVSALGNVIALKLRGDYKSQNEVSKAEEEEKGHVKLKTSKQLDYSKMINGCLPSDIRILVHQEVDETFNARYYKFLYDLSFGKNRFDCTTRIYKYFFVKNNLDIEKMKIAAQKFLGEHDFRNFCKLDVTNTVNYV